MSDSSVLPRELAHLITQCLASSTRRSLCNAARAFGQEPSSDLVTGLVLALPASDCCQLGRIQERLPLITTLTVSADPGQQGRPDPHLPSSLYHLLARVCPSMPHLTHQRLCDVGLDTVASAAASLGASCAQLTDLELQDSISALSRSLHSPGLHHALRALAVHVPTLRHLSLDMLALPDTLLASSSSSSLGSRDPAAPLVPLLSLDGVGAFTQLRSLSVRSRGGHAYLLPLRDVARLVGLTELTMHNVCLDAPLPGICPSHHLGGLSQLRRLVLLEVQAASCALDKLAAFTACTSLTSLQLGRVGGQQLLDRHDRNGVPSFAVHWNALRVSYAQLVRADIGVRDIFYDCADSLDLPPALRELRCDAVALPPRGWGVCLPNLRVLDCNKLLRCERGGADDSEDAAEGAEDVAVVDGEWVAPQPLAQTFPGLVSLRWGRPGLLGRDGRGAGVPNEACCLCNEALSAAPEGRLVCLRRLACNSLAALLLGQCLDRVEELVVGPHRRPGDCSPDVGSPLSAMVSQLNALRTSLRRVELRDPQVDDAGVAALVAGWPALEEVVIGDADCLTDVGLAALAGLPCLRRVTLVRCAAITLGGIQALVAHWAVECIEVCGCVQVGVGEVAQLHGQPGSDGRCYGLRPQLDVVHLEAEREAAPWWKWSAEEGTA